MQHSPAFGAHILVAAGLPVGKAKIGSVQGKFTAGLALSNYNDYMGTHPPVALRGYGSVINRVVSISSGRVEPLPVGLVVGLLRGGMDQAESHGIRR
jgi:hypothetical protein